MSANNQTLIKRHENKYYVFENVMAESWCHYDGENFDESRMNELDIKDSKFASESKSEAWEAALKLEEEDSTEYGIIIDVLAKDRADVKIIN
jgi:hypothetical protein